MNEFLICPQCGEALCEACGSLICKNRHCFDRARQGYVNLLLVQNKHSRFPGDSREMIIARREFLSSGHYEPLRNELVSTAKKYAAGVENPLLLDVGCGEGYYLTALKAAFEPCTAIGADISKDAVRAAAKIKDIDWIVATGARLPIKSDSVDVLTAVFSLFEDGEYHRVLKDGGIAIEATAGNDHLKELKSIIYDEVFVRDKKPAPTALGFAELERRELKFEFTVNHSELMSLLMMTPHTRRIKPQNRLRLESIESLRLTADIWIRAVRKQPENKEM